MSWHYEKYKHNKKVFDYLSKSESNFHDWEEITLFYAILHLVDDYFEKNGYVVPSNHRMRNMLVGKYLSHLLNEYDYLFDLGMRARYKKKKITKEQRDRAITSFSILESKIE